jgi:hypothetical protein
MIRTTAIAFILAASSATADMAPDRVSILAGSRHIGAAGMFNETNPGVMLTWSDVIGSADLTVGAYHNSYSDTSTIATMSLPVINWDGGELSVFGGFAHYPDQGDNIAIGIGDVIPMGGFQINHGNLFAQVIPMNGKPVDAIVSFGFTFEVGQ